MKKLGLLLLLLLLSSPVWADRDDDDDRPGRGHAYGREDDDRGRDGRRGRRCRRRGRDGCGGGHGDPGANELPLWLMGSLSLLAYKLKKKPSKSIDQDPPES